MFGQPDLARPEPLKEADAAFVRRATADFGGDRKLAAIAWTGEAQRFIAEGNLEDALQRYNEAWLLDDTNYEVYWGFGRIMAEVDRFDDAIKHLDRALTLCTDPLQRPAVLADLGAAYAAKAASLPADYAFERPALFTKANAAFTQSTTLDPQNASAWRRWSTSLAEEGRYADAAAKAQRAQALGARPRTESPRGSRPSATHSSE